MRLELREDLVLQLQLLRDGLEDEVGAVERTVEVIGDLDTAVVALSGQHPSRHPADDLAPVGVDVLQPELAQIEALPLAGEPGDELGRVGRTSADNCDLHPSR